MKLFTSKLLLFFLGGGGWGWGDQPWGPGTLVDMVGSPKGSLKIFLEHSLVTWTRVPSRELVACERWLLMRGGRLREVVAYERRSLKRGGRLREVVAYKSWLLTRGGCLREVVTQRGFTIVGKDRQNSGTVGKYMQWAEKQGRMFASTSDKTVETILNSMLLPCFKGAASYGSLCVVRKTSWVQCTPHFWGTQFMGQKSIMSCVHCHAPRLLLSFARVHVHVMHRDTLNMTDIYNHLRLILIYRLVKGSNVNLNNLKKLISWSHFWFVFFLYIEDKKWI